MGQIDRLTVLDRMLDTGLVPLFYHSDFAIAKDIVNVCTDGGARVLEFTNRGDKAIKVFSQLVDFVDSARLPIILGVGSVLDPATAALFIGYGANFVVGPALNLDVAKTCNRKKIAYLPGCGSVTEISTAEESGVEIVKIFPGAQVGGPAFIKAILGPMPWTRIMPTGGVDATKENVQEWIKAGAACLGMGSKLIRKNWVASGDTAAIQKNVQQVLTWIAEAKKSEI